MKITKTQTGNEFLHLESAKIYLQATDYEDENDLIRECIVAAREFVEEFCGISLVEKSIVLESTGFNTPFMIPYPPIQSISTYTIDGIDLLSADTAKDGYIYDVGNKLHLEYTAGYTDIPESLSNATKRIMRIFYDNRSTDMKLPLIILQTLQKYSRNMFL